MTKMIRKGSLRIKCKECHTEHFFDGRDMVFDKSGVKEREGKLEKKWVSEIDFFCKCDTKIKVMTEVIEFPVGIAENIRYENKNAELLSKPVISFLTL